MSENKLEVLANYFEYHSDNISVCLMCGSLVSNTVYWMEIHKQFHVDHDLQHHQLAQAANRYIPPPVYGAMR